jgi:hypothetical protein
MDFKIDDCRDSSFFTVSTFSKYQKTEVKKKWVESAAKSDLEATAYWTTELVCSGLFSELWELILFFFAKYVGNPKLVMYLDYRFQIFKKNALGANELELRNNATVRKIFAEIGCVFCLSPKKPGLDQVKVKKDELELNRERLKAPSADFIKPFFQDGDPMDLFTPLNELCFAVHSGLSYSACYWIEWLLLYDKVKPTRCLPRGYVDNKKLSTDVVWIVWDILRAYAKPGLAEKAVEATLNLFCLRFTASCIEKRRFLLYFAVSLCCDPVDPNVEMVPDKERLALIIPKCALFYKDIRKKSIRLKGA